MLTHDEIRAELIRQIDAGEVKQAAVARALSVAPARISEVRKGDRQIQAKELAPLAEFLGMVEKDPTRAINIEAISYIPHYGKVAQGVWLEQSEPDGEESDFVAYDRMRGDPPPVDLFAVTPEGNSMNRKFMPGTRLICRRVPFGSGQYRSGDYVICERQAHDLREMTCKRLEIDDEGCNWLHSESDDPRFAEPWRIGKPDDGRHDDIEVSVLGKVVRAVIDFENA